jgi:hypothetical protein
VGGFKIINPSGHKTPEEGGKKVQKLDKKQRVLDDVNRAGKEGEKKKEKVFGQKGIGIKKSIKSSQ